MLAPGVPPGHKFRGILKVAYCKNESDRPHFNRINEEWFGVRQAGAGGEACMHAAFSWRFRNFVYCLLLLPNMKEHGQPCIHAMQNIQRRFPC